MLGAKEDTVKGKFIPLTHGEFVSLLEISIRYQITNSMNPQIRNRNIIRELCAVGVSSIVGLELKSITYIEGVIKN